MESKRLAMDNGKMNTNVKRCKTYLTAAENAIILEFDVYKYPLYSSFI
jgi:hypothetical protein